MKLNVREFFARGADTLRENPVETLLAVLFTVQGVLMVGGGEELTDAGQARMALYPLIFTLAYVLNRLLTKGPARWAYFLSPLLLLPFLWVDISNWIERPSYITAVGLCPALLLLWRWRRDNAGMAVDAIRYCKNGFFAGLLAGCAQLMVMAIYFSLLYIFPDLQLGDDNKVLDYAAVALFVGATPLVFLNLDRSQRRDYNPVRIADTLVNYVLTPAIIIYAAILYVYFVKIAVRWTLPEGGIAYLVFGFTMLAVAVKAYMPLMGKKVMGWFYERFPLISLPALAMFWIGVSRRVGEYGLTEGRVYLIICGAAMTFTVLMFLIKPLARYRWTVLGVSALFALVAFFPAITAERIAVRSQHGRFMASARRLDILAADERPRLEKLPSAADTLRQRDYAALYEAFDYICDHSEEADVKARYGLSDIGELNGKIMPDDMPRGRPRERDERIYLNSYRRGVSVDISAYSTMHALANYKSDENHYYYDLDSLRLTVYSPSGEEVLREPLARILSAQLLRAGLDTVRVYSEEELEEAFPRMMFYETPDCGVTIGAMQLSGDGELAIKHMELNELFLKR